MDIHYNNYEFSGRGKPRTRGGVNRFSFRPATYFISYNVVISIPAENNCFRIDFDDYNIISAYIN